MCLVTQLRFVHLRHNKHERKRVKSSPRRRPWTPSPTTTTTPSSCCPSAYERAGKAAHGYVHLKRSECCCRSLCVYVCVCVRGTPFRKVRGIRTYTRQPPEFIGPETERSPVYAEHTRPMSTTPCILCCKSNVNATAGCITNSRIPITL